MNQGDWWTTERNMVTMFTRQSQMIRLFKPVCSFLQMTTTAKLLTMRARHKMGRQVKMYTLSLGWFTSTVFSSVKKKLVSKLSTPEVLEVVCRRKTGSDSIPVLCSSSTDSHLIYTWRSNP